MSPFPAGFCRAWRAVFCLAVAIGLPLATTGIGRAGLIINATFDSSITSDPNAAQIEGVINTAINTYESHFTDPITVKIDFQEMTSGLGQSSWYYYNVPYSQFIAKLQADATTANDATALASLPNGSTNPVNGNSTINVKTAELHALGFIGHNSGLTGGYDGIVSVNTTVTDVGSPGTTGQYSLISVLEHEMDEVLGLGSGLDGGGLINNDPLPEDLFRYTQGPGGTRSYTTSGDNAYFSIDGGNTDLARFNQDSDGDHADWWSNNGGGNPGPIPPPQVQDAFAFPGTHPQLGVEYTALDVIGYNYVVPEPSTVVLLSLGGAGILLALRRRS